MAFRNYREKLVKVKAVQWFPKIQIKGAKIIKSDFGYHLKTPGAQLALRPGYWIIKSGKNFDICDNKTFNRIYEAI